MTIFTTFITAMYTLPQIEGNENVVVAVMWQVTGVDGEHTASINGNSQITLSDKFSFTAYSELTEAQVIGWIDSEAIENAQQCVQSQIESMITPPVSPTLQALPWVTA